MQKSVIVCVNRRANPDVPACANRGGEEIVQKLEDALSESAIKVVRFHCLGCCEQGPNIKFSPGGEFWHHVRLEDVPLVIERVRD